MKHLWSRTLAQLPEWAQELLQVLLPALQVLLILLAAFLLQKLLRRLIRRLTSHYSLPDEFNIFTRRIGSFLILGGALLLALERLGVSSGVLWGAFTSFAAVGAVAFFAAWSVLSNIFCSLLIFTTRVLRLHDHVELLEGGDKPGLKGRVVDINLIYTTLQETGSYRGEGTVLKVPNSLFFQRTLRHWPSPALNSQSPLPAPRPFSEAAANAPASAEAAPAPAAAAPA